MKLTVKTLKGEVINIEIADTATVLDLKNLIHAQKGLEVDTQKIVFKGKSTTNTDVLETLGVKENDFLVVMTLVKKPVKKQEPKKEETSEKQEGSKKQAEPEKKEQVKPSEQKKEKKEGENNEQFDADVNELISMGFEKQKCQAALRAAYNNKDRAVEYLLSGIPQQVQQRQGDRQGGSEGVQHILRMLVNNPSFAQIRQVIRNDPSTLPLILQQISQSSPELYQIISTNPEAFQRVIMEDGVPSTGQRSQRQAPPGVIQVTHAESEAIQRLMSFGFTKMDAAQAYFACDKNQELAANLLFDRQANGDLEPMSEQPGNQDGQGGKKDKEEGSDDDDNLFN